MKKSSTKKRPKSTSTQPDSAAPTLPKDLSDKWGAVEACATAFNLVNNGFYKHGYLKAVEQTLIFLAKLHEQAMEDILKHPEAHLIPELKTELEKRANKGEASGKEETTNTVQ